MEAMSFTYNEEKKMDKPLKRIAVTGGAGQIAYSLLFRIASGEMLGPNQPIALHILELPEMMPQLEGVAMELGDSAFPLLKEIVIGSSAEEVFSGVDYALLVGSKPRSQGMERKELLEANGKIFIQQGRALSDAANKNVLVLVVGNPCNTNCLIALKNAKNIPKENFHALTRLDENRATYQLALKAKKNITDVSNVIIWGNHSSTQVPDSYHAKIEDQPVSKFISDENWLENTFFDIVQKRGAAIISARGKSSAASAASGAIDAFKAILNPTPAGKWFSSAVYSRGNPYGIQDDLVFSFPCRSLGEGKCEIVKGLAWNDFLSKKIKLTELELIEEKACIESLLT